MSACEFRQHSGASDSNPTDCIFLETGISLYRVATELKYYKLNVLGELIEEIIGLPPNMVEYNKWIGILGQLVFFVSFAFCQNPLIFILAYLSSC